MKSRWFSLLRSAFLFPFRYLAASLDKNRFAAPDTPRISFEVTNYCNANCSFCPNEKMKRRREPLSMDIFIKGIDEMVKAGGKYIDFNVTIGDPLLDKKLLEKARYVKKFPQFEGVGFVTTLQWLQLFDIDDFFDAGFTWLSISTVLTGRKKYNEFFGVDKYESMLENLKTLLKENRKRNTPIDIEINIKPTNESIDSIIDHPDFKLIHSLAGYNLIAHLKKRSFFVDDWMGAVKLPAYLKKRPLAPRMHRPCRLLYSGLMVYSNGKVGACSCRDFEANSGLILGDLKDSKLMDMWRGNKLSNLRHAWKVKNKVPDICKNCSHYLY